MSAKTSLQRTIGLDRDDLLRIYDGKGLRVTNASGVLWITEEQSANDTVLLPGETHELEAPGLALVQAHRPSCVVLEQGAGTTVPRRVELAFTSGSVGRRLGVFPTRWRVLFDRWSRVFAITVHRALLRAFVARTQRLWRACDGSTRVHPFPYY